MIDFFAKTEFTWQGLYWNRYTFFFMGAEIAFIVTLILKLKLEEKAACKPLTTRDRATFDQLAKRESQLQSVTAFLPKVRWLYQVTRIDKDTLEHEEIIRGARTGSGDYKPGQGNLEKALRTIP